MSLFGDIFHGIFGGSDAPPPDPNIGLAAQSNADIGARMQTLAETQYTDQKALLDKYSPMFQDQIQAAIDAQTKSSQQSDDQLADYKTTFRPVEQSLAKQSLAYSDPNRIDQGSACAGGMAQTGVDQAQHQNEQALNMAGAGPEKIARCKPPAIWPVPRRWPARRSPYWPSWQAAYPPPRESCVRGADRAAVDKRFSGPHPGHLVPARGVARRASVLPGRPTGCFGALTGQRCAGDLHRVPAEAPVQAVHRSHQR